MKDVEVTLITRPDESLIKEMSANIREADREEIECTGYSVEDSLRSSIIPGETWKAEAGGKLLAIYGTGRFYEKAAAIWCVCTKEVEHHHKELVSVGLAFIRHSLIKYESLVNFISKDNTRALRYIKHAGAELLPAQDINGHEFIPFIIRR